jgi:hypothetical protein
MGRGSKQLHSESDKPSKRVESYKSSESDKSGQHACPRHSARTCNCTNGSCADSDIDREYSEFIEYEGRNKRGNEVGNKVRVKDRNEDRDKHTYVDPEFGIRPASSGSIRTEGQGAGSRIRYSNESRSFEQPNPDAARTNIESVTGIPAGVTV